MCSNAFEIAFHTPPPSLSSRSCATAVARSETFRDSPASVTALTHHSVALSCYAPDPSPPPSVVWLHNDILQTADGRRTITYNSTTGRSEYQINEVAYSDAGQYRCLALDELGDIVFQSAVGTLTVNGVLLFLFIASFNFHILLPPLLLPSSSFDPSITGQPTFAQRLPPVATPLGSQATFQCHVISNPPATVSWTFGSPPQPLASGGRIFLNASTLIISNVQQSDVGYYQCVAENAFGVNATSAPLSIGGESYHTPKGDCFVPLHVTEKVNNVRLALEVL